MAELRTLDKGLCDKCIFWPERDNGCNYMGATGQSRVFKDGKRVVPPGCCDKFIEGSKISKRIVAWGHKDMDILFVKEKDMYERRYKRGNHDDIQL